MFIQRKDECCFLEEKERKRSSPGSCQWRGTRKKKKTQKLKKQLFRTQTQTYTPAQPRGMSLLLFSVAIIT